MVLPIQCKITLSATVYTTKSEEEFKQCFLPEATSGGDCSVMINGKLHKLNVSQIEAIEIIETEET
ncbi:hypothetical protein V1503_19230 [Bacillus sp. SCS-151]|uniref:hypothetical protein n=1 Tax=Nanhaiella sioensis TaxID=3115293 RepID=UPI00397C3852